MKPTDKQIVEWARKAQVANAWDINWFDPYYASFAILAYEAGAAAEREPVIDKSMAKRIATQLGWEPKREWVGLTEEEVSQMEKDCLWGGKDFNGNLGYWAVYRAIEAKLKEKNT